MFLYSILVQPKGEQTKYLPISQAASSDLWKTTGCYSCNFPLVLVSILHFLQSLCNPPLPPSFELQQPIKMVDLVIFPRFSHLLLINVSKDAALSGNSSILPHLVTQEGLWLIRKWTEEQVYKPVGEGESIFINRFMVVLPAYHLPSIQFLIFKPCKYNGLNLQGALNFFRELLKLKLHVFTWKWTPELFKLYLMEAKFVKQSI